MPNNKHYKLAILIGRFQPAHNGHFHNLIHASRIADYCHILIGSAYQPRTIKNPFTAQERRDMISDSLWEIPGNTLSIQRIGFSFIRDYLYNNLLWISEVQETIRKAYPTIADEDICILGYEKDESSWYLRAFPKWDFIPTDEFVEHNNVPIDATKIRELLFEGNLTYIKGAVPPRMFEYLKRFSRTPEYELLVEEYNHIKEYKKAWSVAPYDPIFFTTDAVVVQGGHILLVKRKFAPGKGLWALPGGFIKQKETAKDSCIRELREETGLKVPEIVLRKGITHQRLFDDPDRSLRGRTITQAFLIELDGGDAKLPRVKGRDDAAEAKWFPVSEAVDMTEQLFEDHNSIIKMMTGRAE
jgi:bifunctional NMN adenylyltransferase/nudix hydrolase